MPSKELENSIKYLLATWSKERAEEVELMSKIRYSGISFGVEEYTNLMDALFTDWWSGGQYTIKAERAVAEMCQRNHALLFNSGSTANLALMLAARELYFKDGDKVLTLACGFPTTVNPIIHAGLTPVFADVSLSDLSLNPDLLNSVEDVRGIFIPHTLGFYGDIDALLDKAREKGIYVFYDACDAYGTYYKGKPVTHYGKAATLSFYVAHHLSCGEGGGVVTNDNKLYTVMRGIRNWGRYCSSPECCVRSIDPESFCPPTKYTTDSEVPDDYMVNYQFEWMGYNLKPLEIQAAILLAQIPKLQRYNKTRIENYNHLNAQMKLYEDTFFTWTIPSDVSPFSYPFIISPKAKFKRKHLLDFLRRNKIEARMIFGGNLLRHPAYGRYKNCACQALSNSDAIIERGMMLGCSHVISRKSMEYVCDKITEFMKTYE